jgi:glucokinase
VPTASEDGIGAVLERIARVAGEVRHDTGGRGLPAPVGVSISSPGPLDPWRGLVIHAPNLKGWRNVPLGPPIAEALELPTFVERDTNVAVMAEWRYGAARGTRDAVYITVSTGIGGGLIIDGRPLVGRNGTAGEVGHLTVELDGPTCGCGGIGHVEAIASGTALAREGRELLRSGHPDSPLARLAGAEGVEVDAVLVAKAAIAGDEACIALLERAWTAIGALCASLVNLLDPEIIVIGGSIAEHHPRLFEVARRELGRRAFPEIAADVRLEPPVLGADVSLIGGLPIVNDRLDDPAFAAGSHPQQGALSQ